MKYVHLNRRLSSNLKRHKMKGKVWKIQMLGILTSHNYDGTFKFVLSSNVQCCESALQCSIKLIARQIHMGVYVDKLMT